MYARDSESISRRFCSRALEAGDDTYQAVYSLWDDALDFSEPDSEEEEDEEKEEEEQD